MLARRWVLLSIVAPTSVFLLYVLNSRFQRSGLQAEARLMLGYLSTLQRAHFLEKGSYSYFESYYGASIEGEDNCQQPEAARVIGFTLGWCHYENSPPLRYAYRVIKPSVTKGPQFQSEAVSGSDQKGRSFICLFENQTEAWRHSGSDAAMTTKCGDLLF